MKPSNFRFFLLLCFSFIFFLLVNFQLVNDRRGDTVDIKSIRESVVPSKGFTLPITWGNIGPKLIEIGVIDLEKFETAVYLTEDQRKILTEGSDTPISIDHTNGQFIVDILWPLGLAQKSLVYEEGPLGREYKDRQGNFASTGGWSLAKTDAVYYLGKHDLLGLSPQDQKRVSEIAKNVYRPCCGNPTWFPDCNHGMAALAAIELLVAAGFSDDRVYKEVLKLNSFWFPETYLVTALYFDRQGVPWKKVNAKEVLGAKYSSGQGAYEIAKKVGPLPAENGIGGSCST